MPQNSSPRISLKKKKHNGPDTNKRKKKRAMMILCSFSPCPDDALLARGATYRKKKDSLYYFEKRIVGLTDEPRGKYEI